mmetsp:Transcript_22936/g.53678  ORF Transcript_22936/g.53678 Transcript_22936/m.53678 type:complete len:266 (-) Transcript_22936:75-872(-)
MSSLERKIWFAAVCHGYALRYAPDELRSDRTIVLGAVSRRGGALQHASAELRNDRSIVLAALSRRGDALQYASEALRADRAIVLAAVSRDGDALRFASDALRSDRVVLLAAACNRGDALQHALPQVRGNRKMMQELVEASEHGFALQFASEELLEDPTFMPDYKEQLYLIKVIMMSGRSCVLAYHTTEAHLIGAKQILADCARRLGLSQSQRRRAELLLDTRPVPKALLDQWPAVSRGHLLELQLLVVGCHGESSPLPNGSVESP